MLKDRLRARSEPHERQRECCCSCSSVPGNGVSFEPECFVHVDGKGGNVDREPGRL